MGRTTQDISLPSTNVDQVRAYLAQWTNQNGYKVLDWNSQGQEVVNWHLGSRVKLTPRPGSIVALRHTTGGAIALEVLLTPQGQGTQVHCEGYAAGAGFGFSSEMDLSPNPGMSGMLPRKKGYEHMMGLFSGLSSMGGVPFQPTAPQPGYPQQQQQAYQQPPQQQQAYGRPPQPQQPQAYQQPQQPQQQYPQAYQQPQQPQQQQSVPQPLAQQRPPSPTPAAQPATAMQGSGAAAGSKTPSFCTHCGKALPPDAKFCGGCGKPVTRIGEGPGDER